MHNQHMRFVEMHENHFNQNVMVNSMANSNGFGMNKSSNKSGYIYVYFYVYIQVYTTNLILFHIHSNIHSSFYHSAHFANTPTTPTASTSTKRRGQFTGAPSQSIRSPMTGAAMTLGQVTPRYPQGDELMRRTGLAAQMSPGYSFGLPQVHCYIFSLFIHIFMNIHYL